MTRQDIMQLPPPQIRGQVSLEETLQARRTTRAFSSKQLSLTAVSQLLWALQGVTRVENPPGSETIYHRAAPSAGHTFPLEVYVALGTGFFHYEAIDHNLRRLADEDLRTRLSTAAVADANQRAIQTAPLTIVLAADNRRALNATPIMESALRYAHLEAGHAAQNLALQATALGLGLCTITSFQIGVVYETLSLPADHRPIYLLAVGFGQR